MPEQETTLLDWTAAQPALQGMLTGMPRLAVAYSGGLDSRFLCHAALRLGCDVLAVHARGPHIPRDDSRTAADWAGSRGLRLMTVAFDPLTIAEVARTDRRRCYFCKRGLVAKLRQALAEAGEGDRILCDGTNADDMRCYRPGLLALAEHGVRSPLAEAGLGKAALREAAAATGLERPDQRARPCLLTRFAYGLPPSIDCLRRLEAAESALAALRGSEGQPCPLGDFRLRLRPAPLLQAERLPQELRQPVRDILRRYGFFPCDTAVAAHVSGFYD